MKIAGIVLIIIGIIALVYKGFSFEAPHKDAQIGSLVIQHDETHNVWISPVVGVACIVGGGVLFAVSGRSKM